jgi:hypothetical protein
MKNKITRCSGDARFIFLSHTRNAWHHKAARHRNQRRKKGGRTSIILNNGGVSKSRKWRNAARRAASTYYKTRAPPRRSARRIFAAVSAAAPSYNMVTADDGRSALLLRAHIFARLNASSLWVCRHIARETCYPLLLARRISASPPTPLSPHSRTAHGAEANLPAHYRIDRRVPARDGGLWKAAAAHLARRASRA